MYLRNWEDFFAVNSDGTFVEQQPADIRSLLTGGVFDSSGSIIMDGPSGTQIPGSVDGTGGLAGGTFIPIHLLAGVTYSFSERPALVNGITDPFLALFNSDKSAVIAQDDDGGFGHSSLFSFTPTADGDYWIYAASFTNLFEGGHQVGNFTVDIWDSTTAPDASDTIVGANSISVGAPTFGQISTTSDVDVYAITLTAGLFYTFSFSGGVAANGELGEPGSVKAKLDLLDASGAQIATNTANESGIGFLATTSGTYYVRASSTASTTGGYTLDVSSVDPATKNPLDSIIWKNAANAPFVDTNGADPGGLVAYVYFAAAGENFGEKQGDNGADGIANSGDEALISLGWNSYEKAQLLDAMKYYEEILGVHFQETTDVNQATFRLITTKAEPYGARFYPQDPVYGTQKGIGTFNVDSGGWAGFPQSLQEGGFSYSVILHEFGHALGLSHPHDTGGGSEIMLGVTASQGSYGIYNLNQGVYTVMSYNEAWDFHPDGPSAFTVAGIDNGWSTLGAFDIAALQQRYGVTPAHTGDDVYTLTDVVDDAFYKTIWDSAGNDTIAYNGNLNAQIDLTAATLDYSPTGGGALSFLHNASPTTTGTGGNNSFQVRGGFTIANGVVIENATGGGGNDVLIGNAANNQLRGNAGADNLLGRAGDDKLYGGDGADVLNGGAGNDQLFGGTGVDKFVFTEGGIDQIMDYQLREKIDLSALGVNASDVQISKQYVLVDLDGQPDLRIMFNTKGFAMSDIIFEDASSSLVAGSTSSSQSLAVGSAASAPLQVLGASSLESHFSGYDKGGYHLF